MINDLITYVSIGPVKKRLVVNFNELYENIVSNVNFKRISTQNTRQNKMFSGNVKGVTYF